MRDVRETTAVGQTWAEVMQVSRRIPPLWDLANYVAVNPFLGLVSSNIEDASQTVADGLGARVLPGLSFYQGRWASGEIEPIDLHQAASRLGRDADPLEDALDGESPVATRKARLFRTYGERHDLAYGTTWEDAVLRQLTRWCAVHASGGGTFWSLPAHQTGLYASWREAASADRTLEILGLEGFRRFMRTLPASPAEAVALMLWRLGISAEEREAYLYRLLKGVYGWASYFRRESWTSGDADPQTVAELLAIRVCADAAVAELAPRGAKGAGRGLAAEVEDESALMVLQEAFEDTFVRRLVGRLNPPGAVAAQPAVQGVFCIDVRSEPFRRNLEALDASIETRGFAGFFGVALDWHREECGSPRCPVLLRPAVTVEAEAPAPRITKAATHFQAAPAGAFNFVEVLGLAYGLGLAADALAVREPGRANEEMASFRLNIPLTNRVDLASGILKNTGLGDRTARLVMLCGHDARTANNPHAAGLDCGACGGHGGAPNARVAAALLNDPEVREGLKARGFVLPCDTLFVAAVHDTTTDEIRFCGNEAIPATHAADFDRLRGWLAEAGERTRAERAATLGLPAQKPKSWIGKMIRRRSRDWSEVRPEWGLARNAAFIAARRSRTRGVDLKGRAFLHEYDASADPDGSILTLILTAPVVVASWINLQYFASTVDNATFGCGTKTIHNRVGTLGVVLGNGGDLRTGLAQQSVHGPDGTWYHEPLRLQVIVEATTVRLDAVLDAQPSVRDLVENGWIRLIALDPAGAGASLRLRSGGWEPVAEVEEVLA